MRVLAIGNRRFAAGLYWLERAGGTQLVRNARRFSRPFFVHLDGQTGYAGGAGDPADTPSLAAALKAHIGSDFWMALVEGDGGGFALIRVRDGAVLADGDEVFEDRDAALAAFDRARDIGWTLHASPGLGDRTACPERIKALDAAAIGVRESMLLAPVPLSRIGRRHAAAALCLAAGAAAALAGWQHRGAILELAAGAPAAVEKAARPEPAVPAAIDGAALVAACREALLRRPPYLPAWSTVLVACDGRFDEPALVALRPELEGRAVLLARWRLEAGRSEPLHRRIAERQLAGWYAASVAGDRAWAVAPLAPVLRAWRRPARSAVAFRRDIDRGFGARGARISWRAAPGGAAPDGVAIVTGRPLGDIARLAAGLPDLEITRVSRRPDGGWRLSARRAAPAAMPRSRFETLARRPADGPTPDHR